MTARALAEGVLGIRTFADQPGTLAFNGLPNGPNIGLERSSLNPRYWSQFGAYEFWNPSSQSTNPPATVYTASPQEAKNIASSPKKPSRWDWTSMSPAKKWALMYAAGMAVIGTTYLSLEHTKQNSRASQD